MGKILVTGGAGYIGSVITELLVSRGTAPVVLDNLTQGHRRAVAPGVPLVETDLSDQAALTRVFAQHSIEAVIHLAALSVVSDSVARPLLYYRENVGGLLNLLEAMLAAGVKKILFSSTAAVYGIPEQIPIAEECPARPVNPYGWTKWIGEQMLTDAQAAQSLHWISLRYFNVAGATEQHGEVHHPETHLIPRILEVALGRRPHLELYGTDYPTPDGTAIRDYIHVLDAAEAHLTALEHIGHGSQIYNLGSHRAYSVREVLACAEKATGRRIPYVESSRRLGDAPQLVASDERVRAELGWKPQRCLEEIIGTAWAWLRRHPNGYSE